MSEWKPIETAPENTEIDVWTAFGRVPDVRLYHGAWINEDGEPIGEQSPTHWMYRPWGPE